MKTYLFSYPYKGGSYSLEIGAESQQEAEERVLAVRYAKYDGVLEAKIPGAVGGWLPRLIVWWKNL